jgi:hypothetical protein
MIDLDSMSDDDKLAALESIHKSIAESKEVQKQKIAANVNLVLQALKKMESDIRARYDETGKAIEKRVANIKDGKDGRNGVDGKAGRDGRSGADGATGPRGADGLNGRDGRDGEDGVSVTDAHIDFDGSLIIHLSTGRVINVGEVVAPDLVEKIKVITNGGGTSQQVLDTLASLQTQINNLIPSQTGNAGKYLTTNGTTTSWSSVAGGLSYQGTWNATTNTPTLASGVGTNGYYYITATAGSTNLDGITDWQIGDWLMFNGTVWQKIDQSNLVTSVAGRTGAITLTTADVGGLGTIATQAANNVSITGGSITGITDLAVADGGTGASNASDARTNLGLVIGTDVLSPTGSAASLTSFPTFNQNTTGTASNVTGTVAIANGGTGETTRQAAMDALAGAVTSGSYLRGNGTDVVMNTIQAADVPTLNQNTTGTASNVTGTVAIANGGTGATTAASALSNLGAVAKAGDTMTGALGFVAGSASTPSLFASGDTNTGIFFPAADTIAFAEGGVEAARFDSTGNLGIGTTSPTTRLTVSSTTGGKNFEVISTSTASYSYNTNSTASSVFGQDSTGTLIADLGTKPIYFYTNSAERARIDLSGNLGIGTSSPTTKLEVNGNVLKIYDQSTSNANLVVRNSTTGNAAGFNLQQDGVNSLFYNSSNGYMAFATNATERARIDSSGNLLVGMTSSSRKLSAEGSNAGTCFLHNTRNVSGDSTLIMQLGGSNTNNTSSYYMFCDTDGIGVRMVVYGNGNVQNVNNSYGAYSDVKLKENIVDATPKLANLMQVKVRNYNLIGEEQKQIGVVAQELETIFPGMVEESPDRDREGNDLGTTTKSVKYSVFVPMLIKGLQEQQAQITTLTQRITALENK